MNTLPKIEAEINRLAAIVGASGYVLPTFGRTEDGARPHIEADAHGYHYVVVERGLELQRNTTRDLDELLYHVFKSVTFSLACDYECAHRIAGFSSPAIRSADRAALVAFTCMGRAPVERPPEDSPAAPIH